VTGVTGVTRGVSRVALATVGALALALLGPLAPARAAGPEVSISAPLNGAVVVGATSVSASGDTGGPVAEAIELWVEGALAGTEPCAEGGATCSVAIPWDATGLPDVATLLEVRLYADGGVVATSAPLAVEVRNPVPSVVISSPEPDDVRFGSFTVQATASIDPALTETTASLTLLADDVPKATVTCPAASTCTEPLVWDATGEVGTQILTVELTTSRGRTATSDGVPVLLTDPVPSVVLTAPPAGPVVGVVPVSATATVPDPLTEYPESVVLLVDGVPTGAAFTCPVGERVCVASFSWDATGLDLPVELSAQVVTTRAREATSDVVPVSPSNPVPTVSITSPTDGATVVGVTEVTATASVPDPLTEFPESVVLLVDGVATGDAFTCPVGERECVASFSWDATGLALPVELSARVVTTESREATSGVVSVTPSNPEPTVELTSPADGASVVGVTEVTATASVPDPLTEFPESVVLLVDGVATGDAFTCPVGERECAASFSWDATGLDLPVELSARVVTTRAREATSGVVPVTPSNPVPTVSITSPADGASVVGVTEVAVSGSVDLALTETVTGIEVFADGASIGTVDCAPAISVCSGSVSWDASGVSGDVALTAELATSLLRTVTSPVVTVAVSRPLPTVAITAPTSGGSVVGRTSVTVQASTDARLTEHPATITVRDGSSVLGTVTCGSSSTCSGSVPWDTTLLAGVRALTATVTTDRARTRSTDPITVTVVTPKPTVTITSPTASAVVSGTSSGVTVTAATDLRRSDVPRTLVLRVDGAVRANATCAGSAHTCTRTLRWNPSAYAGAHVLTVALTTSAGVTVVSPARTVFAASAARVGITRPRVVGYRAPSVVQGRVLAATTGEPVAGARVRVVLDPARGDTRVLTVRTDSRGRYSVSLRPASRTSVTARVLATRWLGTARTSTTLDARAPVRCSVDSRLLAPGESGTGRCVVSRLPVGTPLALTYVSGGRTVTFARGLSRSTAIPFSFLFPAPGTYSLRIVIGRNSLYARTASPLIPVTVR
jgi:hypothetical protein